MPGPVTHVARRPSWDCTACDQPWPCANAKADLAVEYVGQRTALVVYLAACLVEAGEALRHPADLYDRFLGWVPPTLGG